VGAFRAVQPVTFNPYLLSSRPRISWTVSEYSTGSVLVQASPAGGALIQV
jgi:hypothetical protein